MPTYEYECLKCGKNFDMFQQMTAEPLKACIHCGGEVQRLIGGGAGIIFKGSGFYETDYKRASTSTSKTRDSKSSSEPKKTDKVSTDTSGKDSSCQK